VRERTEVPTDRASVCLDGAPEVVRSEVESWKHVCVTSEQGPVTHTAATAKRRNGICDDVIGTDT